MKQVWELGMEEMRQIFLLAKVTQKLENADHKVLEGLQQDLDGLGTLFSSIVAGMYLPLIFNAGAT